MAVKLNTNLICRAMELPRCHLQQTRQQTAGPFWNRPKSWKWENDRLWGWTLCTDSSGGCGGGGVATVVVVVVEVAVVDWGLLWLPE